MKVATPGEKVKSTHLQVNVKSNEKDEKEHFDSKLTIDGKPYQLTGDFETSELTPSGKLVLKHPDGKVDELAVKIRKANPSEFAGDLTVIAKTFNFDLVSSVDAKFRTVDEFNVKIQADSTSLKLNKVVFEALNKGGKGGKKIQFNAKSADKNILSGSTNYMIRNEGDKFILEGSGSFKVNEESKTANFKYMTHVLTNEKDGETGVEHLFDAKLGSKAIDAELKYSNKQFRFHNSYCEEKKQCAHIEIDSKLSTNKKANVPEFNYELVINADLRKLGLSHEFGLKSVTIVGMKFDHTVDVHFQNQEASKYQYSLYLHPTKAGATLTTPKRIVSLEANAIVAKQQGANTESKGEIVLYLDKKNKPNEKTILAYNAGSKVDKNAVDSTMGAKFSTPGLGKDLELKWHTKYDPSGSAIDYDGLIDIFAKPNQKITINGKSVVQKKGNNVYSIEATAVAKSAGLNINIKADEKIFTDTTAQIVTYKYSVDYQVDKVKSSSVLKFEAQPNHLVAYAKVFDKELLNIESKKQKNKDSYVVDTTYSVYGLKTTVTHTEVSPTTIKHTVARKGTVQTYQMKLLENDKR